MSRKIKVIQVIEYFKYVNKISLGGVVIVLNEHRNKLTYN